MAAKGESRVRHLRPAKVVSVLALCLLVPWQLLLSAGFTFTFSGSEPWSTWVFAWAAFWLDIPALVVSLRRPALGTVWFLGNALISAAIAAIFFHRNGGVSREIFGYLFAVWGPKIVVLIGMSSAAISGRMETLREKEQIFSSK